MKLFIFSVSSNNNPKIYSIKIKLIHKLKSKILLYRYQYYHLLCNCWKVLIDFLIIFTDKHAACNSRESVLMNNNGAWYEWYKKRSFFRQHQLKGKNNNNNMNMMHKMNKQTNKRQWFLNDSHVYEWVCRWFVFSLKSVPF